MSNCTLRAITQRVVVITYDISEQPIGTTFKAHEPTDTLPRNVGKELPLHAA